MTVVKMSIVVMNGGIVMPSLTIRYDDVIHHKLKVIAATRGLSLNALLQQLLVQEVDRWEAKYGIVQIVAEEN
jgi:predicted transcriptional regulator